MKPKTKQAPWLTALAIILVAPMFYLSSVPPVTRVVGTPSEDFVGKRFYDIPVWLQRYSALYRWLMENTPAEEPLTKYQAIWLNLGR